MVSKNNYQLYQQKHVDGKQRWGIRKLSVGVASVLLGTTFMLYGNHAVLADTVTSPSDDVTRSTTTQGGNKDKVTEGTTSTPQTSGDSTDKGQGKTLTETPTGTDKQANDQKVNPQVPTTDTEEKVVATNHQDTPQGQNPTQDKGKQTNANETTQNTTNVGEKDPEVTPKVRATRLRLVMKMASAGSGASGSSATGVASGSQDSKSQAASPTSSAAPASQATPATQGSGSAASQISAPANSGNATSSPVSQAGTVSANQTSNTSAAGAPASSDQTVTVDETTLPATQAAILSTNLARLTNFKVGTRQRYSAMLLTNLVRLTNSGTDTTLPSTTQTYTKVDQPLLYDYLLHDPSATGTSDGKTWVDKTVATGVWNYPRYTLDTIFGKTSKPGIITSNPDKYFFAAYVDFSESYHRVILLARSQVPSDKNLYSYTIHTYTQNTSNTTTKPGDSTKEQYIGTGRSKHDLIFKNYDGDSFSFKLNGFEEGKEYGLLPVFDGGLLDPTYGSNTYDQNNKAAEKKSIGFWASAIPQETSTKVRYVDQATGKDIVQPMEISGFGYQGFKVNGDAPTVDGYHLVSSPKSLGLPYEDGTIAPYKVGQTYDLALSDSVVIKQTVINTDGTVRATAYYNGSRLPSTDASKVLGRESYNDHMSFGAPDGKFYTYTNRIGQVDGSYIYYYAKDSDPDGSEMRLHFIDVTGVNNSNYAPSDGPELDVDNVQTIHGNIGKNYNFTYTVPKGYDQVATSDVTGTYSKTHHDAYVYVKKQAENKLYAPVAGAPLTVEQGTTLTTDQAKARVKYNGDVPSDATYAWDPKTPVDTATVGSYTPNVIVTYGDGTTSPVPVTVNVVAKADKSNYAVTAGKPVTLTHGQKVQAGDSLDSNAVTLKDAKGQPVSLPDGAKVVWTTAPDTSEVRNGKTGQAKVVYGDNSESEAVDVTYNVVPSQADKNDAKAKDGLTTDLNKVPAAKDSVTVTDPEGQPVTDFEAEWAKDKTPDVSKPGKSTGTVEITYPDGSKKTVEVPVTVRDENGQ
ncbi:Rib/alpha-like domain-containing protein, partial [Ligilactobacillus agilis]|uniref:Rib/alpha-like domain-containing protein n=1 Tax=Ligilactobacillus agilis TaxID=1601 RepID=UPI0025A3C6AE